MEGKDACALALPIALIDRITASCPDCDWDALAESIAAGGLSTIKTINALWPPPPEVKAVIESQL